MKTTRSFRSTLRSLILSLPLDGSRRIASPVFVHEHECPECLWHLPIVEVFRRGKRGAAAVTDGINYWGLAELSEGDCDAILAAL